MFTPCLHARCRLSEMARLHSRSRVCQSKHSRLVSEVFWIAHSIALRSARYSSTALIFLKSLAMCSSSIPTKTNVRQE